MIQDEHLAALVKTLQSTEAVLTREIEAQRRAEEERASRQILRTMVLLHFGISIWTCSIISPPNLAEAFDDGD